METIIQGYNLCIQLLSMLQQERKKELLLEAVRLYREQGAVEMSVILSIFDQIGLIPLQQAQIILEADMSKTDIDSKTAAALSVKHLGTIAIEENIAELRQKIDTDNPNKGLVLISGIRQIVDTYRDTVIQNKEQFGLSEQEIENIFQEMFDNLADKYVI